jgi:hypothetical protein
MGGINQSEAFRTVASGACGPNQALGISFGQFERAADGNFGDAKACQSEVLNLKRFEFGAFDPEAVRLSRPAARI